MLETTKYARKPFHVDAVRVTAENMAEVAQWVNGDIRPDKDGKQFVKVRVARPMSERQSQAYVGDWVLYAGTGYKVYTHKAFLASFEQESVETTMVETGSEKDDGVVLVTEQPVVTAKPTAPKVKPVEEHIQALVNAN